MATAIREEGDTQASDGRGAKSSARRPRWRVPESTERILLGSLFIAGLFVLWVVVTALGLQPPILLPSPWGVVAAFREMFSSPQIWDDFAASGQELLYGFVLAAVIGIPLGLAIGWYARLGYLLDPFVNLLYAIPRIALGPLLIVWLGIGIGSKIALVFLMAVFPVLLNTSSGMRSLDFNLVRVARCFGAGDMKIFWTLALPGSVPFILGGLRLAVGQALIGVFVAELLGAQNGIGMLIENASEQFQTAKVFAGLIIFAAAGVILTAVVRSVERHFDAWRV
jgi:NitT/TauT family transport system permease protein